MISISYHITRPGHSGVSHASLPCLPSHAFVPVFFFFSCGFALSVGQCWGGSVTKEAKALQAFCMDRTIGVVGRGGDCKCCLHQLLYKGVIFGVKLHYEMNSISETRSYCMNWSSCSFIK